VSEENVDYLIDEMKEITDRVLEEGMQLSKEKKAELLATFEAGKKPVEQERERRNGKTSGKKNNEYRR
jgi:hypothetical protein